MGIPIDQGMLTSNQASGSRFENNVLGVMSVLGEKWNPQNSSSIPAAKIRVLIKEGSHIAGAGFLALSVECQA